MKRFFYPWDRKKKTDFRVRKAKTSASLDKIGKMLSPDRYWLMMVSVCEGRLRVLMEQSGQFDWRL